MKTYKWLTKEHTGGYSDYRWPEAGKWTRRVTGDLMMCENGYHLVTEEQIIGDYMQAELWECEYDGDRIDHDDKICVRRAKLIRRVDTINDRTLRLFAADCAERTLHIFERDYPNDDRPRKAIEAARLFAEGKIDAAAWDAARDTARDTARAAARVAAGAAARVAAGVAAWAAERAWQRARFSQYMRGEI